MTSTYLKMRHSSAATDSRATDNRSKSVDFLELLRRPCFHPHPRPPCALMEKTDWNIETLFDCHDDEINGERFGTVLGICLTVSSPTDPRKGFQLESKPKAGMYYAVNRVFSMRRSASVSERYCRIHDQSDTPATYFEGEDSMDEETKSSINQSRSSSSTKVAKSSRPAIDSSISSRKNKISPPPFSGFSSLTISY